MAEAIIAPPQFHLSRVVGAAVAGHCALILALACGHAVKREGYLPQVQPKDTLGSLEVCYGSHE